MLLHVQYFNELKSKTNININFPNHINENIKLTLIKMNTNKIEREGKRRKYWKSGRDEKRLKEWEKIVSVRKDDKSLKES